MKIMIRNFIASAFVGFMVPTLAYATIETPPLAANPNYLFELSYEDAEGAVGFALGDKGAGNKVAATITGHKAEALFSYNKPISVEIRGLQYDNSTARWSASMLIVSEGSVVSAMPLSGRYEEVVEVPVLKRQVRAGDVIKDADVEIRDFPIARTRSDTITDMASLIGKSPERAISPGRPIRTQEIASPAVIKKNAVVQMRYRSPGIELTTTGQAVEDGSKGSVITVRNLSSRKTVRAMVEDENTVSILSNSPQVSAAAGENNYVAN